MNKLMEMFISVYVLTALILIVVGVFNSGFEPKATFGVIFLFSLWIICVLYLALKTLCDFITQ